MNINKKTKNLYGAVLSLTTETEMKKFFRDLLTEAEIKEFSNRWAVARMLDDKVSYEKIEQKTGMSSTTIARINKWVKSGTGGYQLVLKRLNNTTAKNHHHTPLVAV